MSSADPLVTDPTTAPPTASRARSGRKRDPRRDGEILEATLAVLAELGYEGTTVDLVAARAGCARATVYRRWPTKSGLVLEAVARLSRDDARRDALPDTGSLRGDLAAITLTLDDAGQRVRIQAMAALLSVARSDPELAEAAVATGIGPWVEVNRALFARAVDRGEFPVPADLGALAELIPMMCVARAVQQLPITREFSLALIDGVILPALRGGS